MQVRRAVFEDLAVLEEHTRLEFVESEGSLPSSLGGVRDVLCCDALGTYYICEENSSVIGSLGVQRHWNGGFHLSIFFCFVVPAHRALLSHLLDLVFADQKCDALVEARLQVNESNARAITAFEKAGFRKMNRFLMHAPLPEQKSVQRQSPRVLLEVCVDSLESVGNAIKGGAHRLELCSSLSSGGLTPSAGFVRKACLVARTANVPCFVMIRPRAGDFVYSKDEFEVMLDDLIDLKSWCDGFVFGLLLEDGAIDVHRTKRLVDAAKGMPCTFHRAIDQTNDLLAAVEQVIATGCTRILTSGGATTAEGGADVIRDMNRRSMGRVQIMAGSGINVSNVELVVSMSECEEIHGSFSHGTDPVLSEKKVVCGVDDRSPPKTSASQVASVLKKIS